MRVDRLSVCWSAAVLATAVAASGEAAEIRLEPRGMPLPVAGEVLVFGEDAAEPIALPLREVVDIAAPLPVKVTCRGDGLWCPDIEVDEEGRVTLPVYPSVEVTARLAGPGAGATLRSGSVQGVARDEAGLRPVEFRRDLAVDGAQIRFLAPRVPVDLRFAFAGAAPIYRWSVLPQNAEAASVLDLGTLNLEPGASISGWVLAEESEAPIAEADVKASRLGNLEGAEVPLRVVEAQSNPRGFFQLHGLDPGTYRLEVVAEDRATRVLEAVELPEAAETLLGTIHLGPPIVLSVQVEPPQHPGGGNWTLAVRSVRARAEDQGLEATVDATGMAQLAVERAGEYYVQVFGPEMREAFHFETREVTGSEWVAIELPVVAVEGTVRLGGEPLAAKVTLHGGAGDRSDLESDEEGHLSGWMRRPERPWLMADVAWEEAGRSKQRTVEAIPDLDDDLVEIEIDLPAGVISGHVVDQEGAAQPGVRVTATPEERASYYTEVHAQSDASGRFHLTGLESGRYLVQGGGNGAPASEVVAVQLERALPVAEAQLVLWPTRPVTLSLTVDGRPASGATVGLVGLGRIPVSFSLTTDGHGEAVYALPDAVDRVVATVFDPSRLLWSGCLSIEEDQIRLDLPNVQPATLTVEIEGRTDLPPILSGQHVLLTGSGGFVPYQTFLNWARMRSGDQVVERDGKRAMTTMRLPALAPGRYGITWSGMPEWELGARSCAGAVPDAEWTSVPPTGQATLSVDSSQLQERRLRELRDR